MVEKHTPSLAAIRTWYALDRAMNGEDHEFERGIKEFDRALRKHDADLIESLVWLIRDEQNAESIRQMLMYRARACREGVA